MWLVESSHPLVSLGTVIGRRREVGRGCGGRRDGRHGGGRGSGGQEDGRHGTEDKRVVDGGREKVGGGRGDFVIFFQPKQSQFYLLLCYSIGVMGRNAQCMSAATNISAGRSYPCLSILPRLFS